MIVKIIASKDHRISDIEWRRWKRCLPKACKESKTNRDEPNRRISSRITEAEEQIRDP